MQLKRIKNTSKRVFIFKDMKRNTKNPTDTQTDPTTLLTSTLVSITSL